jgi:hypothetical protein
MAMEARCYRGGEGRTKLNALKYEGRDVVAALLTASFVALILAERAYSSEIRAALSLWLASAFVALGSI